VNSAASCWDALDRPCTDVVELDLGRVECDAPDVDVNVSDSDRDGGDSPDGAVIRGFL
jgi:hypothetical protein